jgi:hypothetical protein
MRVRFQAKRAGSQRFEHSGDLSHGKEQGYWGKSVSRMQRRLMMGTRGRGRGA